jgi:hypothetical protein
MAGEFDHLPGIAPEDVKQTPEQIAQVNAYLAEQKAQPKEEEIELMESEIMGSWKIMKHLQNKYGYRKASFDNLSSMRSEADDLFSKIGLQVVVDWVLPGISIKPTPPTITIVGRLEGFEFNPEQARYEIGHGVADDYFDMKKAQQKNKSKLILPGK